MVNLTKKSHNILQLQTILLYETHAIWMVE